MRGYFTGIKIFAVTPESIIRSFQTISLTIINNAIHTEMLKKRSPSRLASILWLEWKSYPERDPDSKVDKRKILANLVFPFKILRTLLFRFERNAMYGQRILKSPKFWSTILLNSWDISNSKFLRCFRYRRNSPVEGDGPWRVQSGRLWSYSQV